MRVSQRKGIEEEQGDHLDCLEPHMDLVSRLMVYSGLRFLGFRIFRA